MALSSVAPSFLSRLPLRQLRITLLSLLTAVPLLSGSVWAQDTGSVRGQVTPPHDHSFTLADARIPSLGLRVQVAGDGSFFFPEVRPGTYVVEVRVPTLGTSTETVTVTPGEETDVEITVVAGSHFEELFISAPGDRSALDLTTAVNSLSGQELQLRMESSLGETLSGEPGVASTFFGTAASRPIIRGLSGDRVRVMEGGIDSGDTSGISADHAATNDPSQAERIEVLRGPATLLFGSNAIGGAVNIIDERVPSSQATRPIEGTVDLLGGSVADERLARVNLDGGGGNWAWHFDAFTREADDYEIPGYAVLEDDDHGEEHDSDDEDEEEAFGFVPNTDIETSGGRLGLSRFFGDRGSLGIAVSGFDSLYGIPSGAHAHGDEEHDLDHEGEEHEEHDEEDEGEEHDDEHGEEDVRIDMENQRVDLRGEMFHNGFFQASKLRVGVTDYEHTELEGDEVGTVFFQDFMETRVELIQKQHGRSSGSMGLQVSDRELKAIGAEAFIPATESDRLALFTLQELESGDRLTWQLGARWETQDQDAVDNPSLSHDGVSASLGLVADLSPSWSIGSSLARSVKLPAAEELFSDGLHVAAQQYEIGNANLDEEVGYGLDVSLRRTEGRLTGALTFFLQDFSDFIYQAFTDLEEDGFPVVIYAQNDAELSGVELESRVEIFESNGYHLHFELIGDYVQAELDAGGYLPRIPPLRLRGGFHFHSESWTGMAEVQWVDEQADVATNETPTEGYTMVNASVGYRFLFSKQIIDVLLRGRNLTDEEARSHTSYLKNFAPLPGRDVRLSLRLWF